MADIKALLEKYAGYIKTLPDDVQEKIKACKSEAELLKMTESIEGEIPDEVAMAVAGGKEDENADPRFPCWVTLCPTRYVYGRDWFAPTRRAYAIGNKIRIVVYENEEASKVFENGVLVTEDEIYFD